MKWLSMLPSEHGTFRTSSPYLAGFNYFIETKSGGKWLI